MLNTLNILTARQFKKGKQFFVGYIMMYPCHSFLRIFDFEIIFHNGSTWKSKDETTQSIRDTWTWKDGTAYIFHQRYHFSDSDRYATAKLFWTFDYTIVLNFLNHLHHRKLSQQIFCFSILPSHTSLFQQEHNFIKICISYSQDLLKIFGKNILLLQHDRWKYFHRQLTFKFEFSYMYDYRTYVLQFVELKYNRDKYLQQLIHW